MILKIMLDRKGEYVLYDGITSIQKQSGHAMRAESLPGTTEIIDAGGIEPALKWGVSVGNDRCAESLPDYDGIWIDDRRVVYGGGKQVRIPVSILYLNKGNETFTFVVSEAYILNDAGETIQVIRN